MGRRETTGRLRSQRLEAELRRLKEIMGFGLELRVVWRPSGYEALSGEVKNTTIYLYDEDEEKAVDILRHEFIDFCVSRAIEPYKDVTNRLIKMVNEDAYKRKERVVEALTRLIEKTVIENG